MSIVKDINPEQLRNCRARKVERRIYTSSGPSSVWLADTYINSSLTDFPYMNVTIGF